MNTWAFRAPRLFQPWRILAAFHSPAPLAQRKLLTPSGVGYRNKTQTLTCPLNRGKSILFQVTEVVPQPLDIRFRWLERGLHVHLSPE